MWGRNVHRLGHGEVEPGRGAELGGLGEGAVGAGGLQHVLQLLQVHGQTLVRLHLLLILPQQALTPLVQDPANTHTASCYQTSWYISLRTMFWNNCPSSSKNIFKYLYFLKKLFCTLNCFYYKQRKNINSR